MHSFVFLIYFLTIPALYYVFKRPDEILLSIRQRLIVGIIAFSYTIFAFIPSFEGTSGMYQFGFITFPLLYAVILRKYVRKIFGHFLKKWLFVFILIFLLLWAEEMILAFDHVVNGSYLNGFASVVKHLTGYFGFYSGVALIIVIFYKRWNYSLWQVFTIGGIWGIIFEQQFSFFRLLFSGDIFSLIVFISFVFPTYGLYLAGPKFLFYEEFKNAKNPSKWHCILLFLGILILPLVIWWLWNVLFEAIGIDISGLM